MKEPQEKEQESERERVEALRVQQKAAEMEELLREREEMEEAKRMGLDYETGKPIMEEPVVVDPKSGAHSKIPSKWSKTLRASKATRRTCQVCQAPRDVSTC